LSFQQNRIPYKGKYKRKTSADEQGIPAQRPLLAGFASFPQGCFSAQDNQWIISTKPKFDLYIEMSRQNKSDQFSFQ